MKALEETAIILRRLWSEERVTFAGRHFQVSDCVCGAEAACGARRS